MSLLDGARRDRVVESLCPTRRRAWAWRYAPLPTLQHLALCPEIVKPARRRAGRSPPCPPGSAPSRRRGRFPPPTRAWRRPRFRAAASAIDVGAIEEGDAEIERAAEIVAAEPDRGDPQAGFPDVALLYHVTAFGSCGRGSRHACRAAANRMPQPRKVQTAGALLMITRICETVSGLRRDIDRDSAPQSRQCTILDARDR